MLLLLLLLLLLLPLTPIALPPQMSMGDNAVPVEPELPAGTLPQTKPKTPKRLSTPKPHIKVQNVIRPLTPLPVLDPHKFERVIDVINPRVTKYGGGSHCSSYHCYCKICSCYCALPECNYVTL
jgi:hypothetical protein